MTQLKHTPAPWVALSRYDTGINGISHKVIEIVAPQAENKKEYDSLGISVILLPNGEYSDEELNQAEANASLIAAAPELLEALEHLLRWNNMPAGSCAYPKAMEKEICDKALAAIAKARGES